MSVDKPFSEALIQAAAKARALAEAWAKDFPGAEVALARPLDPIPALAAEAAPSGPLPEASAHPRPPFAANLGAFAVEISACQDCGLGSKRRHMVFGEGDPKAPLVFVGGAPGPDEDSKGRPLAGAAGGLFDRMIAAMGYKRREVYVCYTLKCRSWGAPKPEELEACRPLLEQQLSLLAPKVLVALGPVAAAQLLGAPKADAAWRGAWGRWRGIQVMPTHAPEEVLADEGLKRFVWDDLKQVMQALRGKPA